PRTPPPFPSTTLFRSFRRPPRAVLAFQGLGEQEVDAVAREDETRDAARGADLDRYCPHAGGEHRGEEAAFAAFHHGEIGHRLRLDRKSTRLNSSHVTN